ncbi:MAG: photosynthetic reaction center subunit H [Pseudomonadota bacterium]
MGDITGYIDLTQVLLYLFWIFFAALVIYLQKEGKREGFPMASDNPGEAPAVGWPDLPATKVFIMPDGTKNPVPRAEVPRELHAKPSETWRGAPIEPTGHGLEAGIGPGTWSQRQDHPDVTHEGEAKIVPMRVLDGYEVEGNDTDPRGLEVVGLDGVQAGSVSDIWVEKGEAVVRYLEIALEGSGERVLVPIHFSKTKAKLAQVEVTSVLGEQIKLAPRTASGEQVTLLEEDKIMAFYGGGLMYAKPDLIEPLII